MIVGAHFHGDDDEKLIRMQFELYNKLVTNIYLYARDRYLQSVKFLGVETEMLKNIKQLRYIDHRILQHTHDMIAAFFRFNSGKQMEIAIEQGKMVNLSEDETDHLMKMRWCQFFHDECRLLAEDDFIAKVILTAVVYDDDKGKAADAYLQELSNERYQPKLTQQNPDTPGCLP